MALITGWTVEAMAIFVRDDVAVANYNNLATQPQYQAAGYIRDLGSTLLSFCSGTLVTPTVFLTAAHCVDSDVNHFSDVPPTDLFVGFDVNIPAAPTTSNVASVSIHELWDGTALHDLAKLHLMAPLGGITPATLTTQNPFSLLGTMIGYGQQGNGLGAALVGANNRLGARNIIDGTLFPVQTDFDRPNGTTSSFGGNFPVALEGSPCFGDSGGPLFVAFGGNEMVVGVVHGSPFGNPFGPLCQYGDRPVWVPLSDQANLAFLTSQGIPVVPEPGSLLLVGAGLVGLALRSRLQRDSGQAAIRRRLSGMSRTQGEGGECS
jgi:hypothetical protein